MKTVSTFGIYKQNMRFGAMSIVAIITITPYGV